MTIYEIIKENYQKVKSDDKTMWATVKLVSDALKPMKETDPEEYWMLVKDVYAEICGWHFNEMFAEWQIEQMRYKDRNGMAHKAPHWTKEQRHLAYESIKSKLKNPNYNVWDFGVTLEMMYSDNICLLKEWFPNATEQELETKVVESALNYLNDDDDLEGKIWGRFNK